jgi:hypothetical protein
MDDLVKSAMDLLVAYDYLTDLICEITDTDDLNRLTALAEEMVAKKHAANKDGE